MTNAEWIRQMTDENLACILGMLPFTPPGRSCRKRFNEPCMLQGMTCNQCWLEWLEKEVDCNFDGPCDHANPTADKIRQMSDWEFYNWLSAECSKFPVGDCSIYTDCLECWKEHLPLTGRDPVLIELFARRYCPPLLCPAGKRNKED